MTLRHLTISLFVNDHNSNLGAVPTEERHPMLKILLKELFLYNISIYDFF